MSFSWLDWGYEFWGGRSEKLCAFLSHRDLSLLTWPWSPGWHCVCHIQLFFLPLLVNYFLKVVGCWVTTLKEWGVYSLSLRVVFLHKLLEILLHGWLVSHLYVFDRVFVSGRLMDMYSVLWVIIWYWFILVLKLSQLWPWGAPPVGSSCLWQTSTPLEGFWFVFELFLTFWHYNLL